METTTGHRPLVETVRVVPELEANPVEPSTFSDGEATPDPLSEGEPEPVVLTDDPKPVIIRAEED